MPNKFSKAIQTDDDDCTHHSSRAIRDCKRDSSVCLESHCTYFYDDVAGEKYRPSTTTSRQDANTQTQASFPYLPPFMTTPRNLMEGALEWSQRFGNVVLSPGLLAIHFEPIFGLVSSSEERHDIDSLYTHRTGKQYNLINSSRDPLFHELVRSLRKSNVQLAHSTVLESFSAYFEGKNFTFDWQQETKFLHIIQNNVTLICVPKYSYYWLWLDGQHIPFGQVVADGRVTAQVGARTQNFFKISCPEVEKLTDILDSVLALVKSGVPDLFLDQVKNRLISLVTAIYNLLRWTGGELQLQDLIVNLCSSFVSIVSFSSFRKLISSFFHNPIAQSDFETSFLSAIKALFTCVFLVVTSTLPGRGTIDEFVNRVHKIPLALSSIAKFNDIIDPLMRQIISFVEQHILGMNPLLANNEILEEAVKFGDKVAEMADLYKRRAITHDAEVMKAAGKLHQENINMLGRCVNLGFDRKTTEFLRTLLPTTYKISEAALLSGVDKCKPRKKPVCVWFAGQSQVGKSTILYPFVQDMLKIMNDGELPVDWAKEIYAYAPETEYMDGYTGQRVELVDEWNQQRTVVGQSNDPDFPLIRKVNIFPAHCHMASLYEKPNSYYTSELIVLTSNVTNVTAETIKCKEALTNRITYAFKLELKEEYRLYYADGKKYRLDLSKIGDTYDSSIYYFVQFDPLTEQETGQIYSYAQMCHAVAKSFGNEENFFNMYESYLAQNRTAPFPAEDPTPIQRSPRDSEISSSSDSDIPVRPPRTKKQKLQEIKNFLTREKSPASSEDSWTNEWKKPYFPRGPLSQQPWEFSRSHQYNLAKNKGIACTFRNNPKAQVGFSPEFEEKVFGNNPDYSRSTFGRLCNSIVTLAEAPTVATYGVLQKFNLHKWLPSCIRRPMIAIVQDFHSRPLTYVKEYDSSFESEFEEERYEKFVRRDACFSYARKHVSEFKEYAEDRLQYLKSRIGFYLPGVLTRIIGVAVTAGTLYMGFKTLKGGFNFASRSLSPKKIESAEACFLRGCEKCAKCSTCDWSQYKEDFVYWNVPCVCYVEYCNRASKQDAKLFVQHAFTRSLPSPTVEEGVLRRLRQFAECDCSQCVICDENGCTCRAIAEARGVSFGNDDLVDRVDRYKIMQERLEAFTQNQSPPSRRPQQQNVIRVQNNQSPPSKKPQNQQVVKVQNQSPPSRKPEKQNVIRVQHEEALVSLRPESQLARFNDQQAQDVLNNRVWPSILRVYIVLKDESPFRVHRQLGHLTAIGGNVLLMNWHFVPVLQLYPDAEVVLRSGTTVFMRMNTCKFLENFERIGDKDAVLVKVDYKGAVFPKIVKHFVSKSTSHSFKTMCVTLARFTIDGVGKMYPNPVTVTNASRLDELVEMDIDDRLSIKVVQPLSIVSRMPTQNGDCGAPLILNNSLVPSKILGIHNGYHGGLGTAYAVPLFREEIEDTLEKMNI